MKLRKIYSRSKNKLYTLINDEFRFKYGKKIYSLTCIVGENGTGKTRFLNSILENSAGVELIFDEDYEEFGLEKANPTTTYENIARKEISYLKDKFAIIKYSSAIEYSIPNKKIVGCDLSTSCLLHRMRLNELNRYDVINQISVVAKNLKKVSELIQFRGKRIRVILSDEGEAFYRFTDRHLRSYLSGDVEALFQTSKYESIVRKKFLSLLIDELLNYNQIVANENILASDLIRDLILKIKPIDFSAPPSFFKELRTLTSPEFTEKVKKFFKVYLKITQNSNNFLERGRRFNFKRKKDLDSINSVIDYFFFEQDLGSNSIVSEVFNVLSLSWDGLSSGEMSILNLLGRLYSGKRDFEGVETILLLIDEVDLGLHPEWQRLWVSDVLPLISEILCNDFQELQVIITTHSPIILSDILNQDIISVGKKKMQLQTFGQNIYTLFNDSFFLDDVQGKFVSEKLESLSKLLNRLSQKRQFNLTPRLSNELGKIIGCSNIEPIDSLEFEKILYSLINSVGEEMLRNYFFYLFDEINFSPNDRQNKIEYLKRQLEELEREVVE